MPHDRPPAGRSPDPRALARRAAGRLLLLCAVTTLVAAGSYYLTVGTRLGQLMGELILGGRPASAEAAGCHDILFYFPEDPTAMKRVIQRFANSIGLELRRLPAESGERITPEATHAPWATDADFQHVYAAVRQNTMVDIYRLYELWMLVAQTLHLPGDIIEIGVWRGGSGNLLAYRAKQLGTDATVYLCDTFRGMVKTSDRDPLYRGGELSDTSADIVAALTASLALGNVRICPGIFPDESAHLVPARQVRLCHIDVDVYDSARDVLAWVWHKMPVGGIVVYDDYGFPSCAGITAHVDEQRGMRDRVVIHNLNGHAIVVKTVV